MSAIARRELGVALPADIHRNPYGLHPGVEAEGRSSLPLVSCSRPQGREPKASPVQLATARERIELHE
jgi:hypothetical protein